MTKKYFQFQLILKQFLVYFYIARELKQSTYNLLKALPFLEIFLLLLSVMVVELNLPSFKQNRSVNGYFLNCFKSLQQLAKSSPGALQLYMVGRSEGIETLWRGLLITSTS